MKLETIINCQESLHRLSTTKLPVKASYKISKLIVRMQPELRLYEEQKNRLIKELGAPTEPNKDIFQVTAENREKYAEEHGKLTDIEVPLEFGEGKELQKLKVEELGDITLEPMDLARLDWLFE